MRTDIVIRPERKSDYRFIIPLVLGAFAEGTDYSDGTDVLAFVEEIRESEFYIPSLSYVALLGEKIVGHFLFSVMPLSRTRGGGHGGAEQNDIVMMAPVAVHPDYFRQGVGTAMLTMGIAEVKKRDYKGILVEGNDRYCHRFGFRTSSEFGIYPTSGWPVESPQYMMCQETRPGSLNGIGGYVVYDMYENA